MDIISTLPYNVKLYIRSKLIDSLKRDAANEELTEDPFATFSSNWGKGMSTEEYSEMLRTENIAENRDIELW